MTRDELSALLTSQLTVAFAEACQALGVGLTAGRAAQARGAFPVPVIRVGRCLRVPAADLERLLLPKGEPGDPAPGRAVPPTAADGSLAHPAANRPQGGRDHARTTL